MASLVTEHLDIWSGAVETRSTAGRGSSNKLNLYGIKKLRALILELAVRGQLVEQDAGDEPAAVLLERIAAEKARLVAEGVIKKQKVLPEIAEDEKPFELPKSWVFVRFGDATINRDGERKPVSSSNRQDMQGQYDYYGASGVIDKVNDYLFDKPLLLIGEDGANLINRSTPIAFIATGKYWVNNHAHVLDGISLAYLQYLCLFINAISLESYITGTAQPKMNQAKMNSILVAIPPEQEQHRIVAKVNELMSLCDALEQAQETDIAAHQYLVESLLAVLTNAANQGDFNQAWERISQHFDTLFMTEHSIDQLKQTILQLAVMGKLVEQDPNDEPAAVLLEKIAAEKARLMKEKKIKKQKALPEIAEDEKPFELPVGWEWCRLGELLPVFQNGASSRGDKSGVASIVVRLADIKDWRVSLENTRSLIIDEKSIARYSLEKNDVLIIRVNGSADIVGRFITCTQNYDAIYCDHFIRMRFLVDVFSPEYLGVLGSSRLVRNEINSLFISTAGQKTVNQKHIGSLRISLPPLAEQHRIVTKVDQLMTLCDQLKSRINKAQSTRLKLADALAEQAVA